MLLNHIAIIVSNELGVDFYKNLGFIEISRVAREQCHDELICLAKDNVTLEIYKDATHPKRITNPEAYGLRHLCFNENNLEKYDKQILSDNKGEFIFLYDPDGQPIELRRSK